LNSKGRHVTFLLGPEKEKPPTTVAPSKSKPAKLEDGKLATGINRLESG